MGRYLRLSRWQFDETICDNLDCGTITGSRLTGPWNDYRAAFTVGPGCCRRLYIGVRRRADDNVETNACLPPILAHVGYVGLTDAETLRLAGLRVCMIHRSSVGKRCSSNLARR